MGFFDEFKEDLSQALGELNAAGTKEEGDSADTLIPETVEEGVQESLNLSEMIDKIPEPVFDFDTEPKPDPGDLQSDPGLTPDLSFSGDNVLKDPFLPETDLQSSDFLAGEAEDGIKPDTTGETEPEAESEALADAGILSETEAALEEPEAEPEIMAEAPEPEPEVASEPEPVAEPEFMAEAAPEEPAAEPEIMPEVPEPEAEAASEPEPEAEPGPEVAIEPEPEAEPLPEPGADTEPAPVEESVMAAVEGLISGDAEEAILPEEDDLITDTETDDDKETEKMSAENNAEVTLPVLEDGPEADESGCVTAGMTINGDVTSEGSLEVIGAVKGNINVRGKLNVSGSITGNSKASEVFADSAKITGEVISKGAVKVGQESVIIGNITATSAVIAGAVKGDIDVRGPVILDTSAIVMGDIKSKSVQINNGAVVEGHCSQCYAEVSPTTFFDDLKNSVKG